MNNSFIIYKESVTCGINFSHLSHSLIEGQIICEMKMELLNYIRLKTSTSSCPLRC